MALERFRYGDPLRVLERIESGTCRGCVHHDKYVIAGTSIQFCKKGRRQMKRCRYYREKE